MIGGIPLPTGVEREVAGHSRIKAVGDRAGIVQIPAGEGITPTGGIAGLRDRLSIFNRNRLVRHAIAHEGDCPLCHAGYFVLLPAGVEGKVTGDLRIKVILCGTVFIRIPAGEDVARASRIFRLGNGLAVYHRNISVGFTIADKGYHPL